MSFDKHHKALAACAAVAALAAPITSEAALDMYLVIPGIPGESLQAPGAMDVLAWSWGESSSVTTSLTRGSYGCLQDLSLTKYLDKASPLLAARVDSGMSLMSAKLVVRSMGEIPYNILVYDLANVVLTSYSTGASGGEDRPTENIAIHFNSLKLTYTPQDITGKTGSPIPANIVRGTCGG